MRIDVKQDNFCMRILDSTNRWVRHAGREAGLSKDNMTCLRALDSLLEHGQTFWIFREYADSYPMHDCQSDLPAAISGIQCCVLRGLDGATCVAENGRDSFRFNRRSNGIQN